MKRGFTLIELLAVITVLGLILLIIIPKVTSMLKQSNKTTKEESVEMYGRAVDEAIATYFVKYPDEDTVTLQQLENEHMVKYKGPNVSCQVSHIARRKAHLEKCIVNGELINYIYGSYATLISDADNDGEISRGDKYSYEVNDKDEFNFYVLSVEEGTVNLIMDRNICTNGEPATKENTCLIAWYDDGDNPVNYTNDTNEFGPVTAMEGMYNATKNWTNVPDMNLDYSDEGHIANSSIGYGKIETTEAGIKITKKDEITEVTRSDNQTPVIPYETNKPLKARLPKIEEVYNTGTDATHCHNSSGSCPSWLTNGLTQYSSYYQNNEHISEIYGYWTLSSNPGNSDSARRVYCSGYVGNDFTSIDGSNGVRPVITVSMSDLS